MEEPPSQGDNPTEYPRESPSEPVSLVKGRHRWTFWCEPGEEPELLRRLSELAGSVDAPFDWFDAALVSHQLSRRLKPDLNRVPKTTENKASSRSRD